MTRRLPTVVSWPASILLCLAGAVAQGQTLEFYELDAVGSVRVVTDGAGQVVSRHDYLPFGEECTTGWCAGNTQPGLGQPRKFTGKERDAETGLDYFGARYYTARIGRFSTIDPVQAITVSLSDPQRWNRYAYALNSPLKFNDPDGRATYLVIYGSGYLNYRLQGQRGDVGGSFQVAAETRAREISSRASFNAAMDAVHLVEARSTASFVGATNASYTTGAIAELHVYSHAGSGGLFLGGEIGNEEQRTNWDLREINFATMTQVNKDNFSSTACVTFHGCHTGEGFAGVFAEYLGEHRTVSGFQGPSEFADAPGGGLTMVPTYPDQGMVTFP